MAWLKETMLKARDWNGYVTDAGAEAIGVILGSGFEGTTLSEQDISTCKELAAKYVDDWDDRFKINPTKEDRENCIENVLQEIIKTVDTVYNNLRRI
jgi:hypothetical protein